MYLGNIDISDFKVGTVQVSAVYLGGTLVWSSLVETQVINNNFQVNANLVDGFTF